MGTRDDCESAFADLLAGNDGFAFACSRIDVGLAKLIFSTGFARGGMAALHEVRNAADACLSSDDDWQQMASERLG